MPDRAWTRLWPSWVSRWYGIVLRVLVGVLGMLAGLGLIWLAGFAATFKKTQPEWDGEALTVLFLGMVTVVVAIALAVRPSRLTFVLAALTALAIPIVGGII